MDRAVDRDETEDELVSQNLSTCRQLDLVARLDVLSTRVRGDGPSDPVVAAQASVPSLTIDLANEALVRGADQRGIRSYEFVSLDSTDHQLVPERGFDVLWHDSFLPVVLILMEPTADNSSRILDV
jgi:hypothetical protein